MIQITPEIESLIDRALTEDLCIGDPTTEALIPPDLHGRANLVSKAEGILAGIDVALAVFRRVDSAIEARALIRDGSVIHAGDVVAQIEGRVSSTLKGERTALNFLQRLSGIATETGRVCAGGRRS